MAVKGTGAVANRLTRSGAYIDTSGSFSIVGWLKIPSLPPDGQYANARAFGDADNYANPYLWLGTLSTAGVANAYLEVFDGTSYFDTADYPLAIDTWYGFGIVVDQALGEVRLYVVLAPGGAATLLDTLAVDVSAIAFVETTENAIGDAFASAGDVGSANAYDRVFPVALTPAQIAAELNSVAAILTADADTPLTTGSDLADASGNGRDWTGVGSLATLAGPAIPAVVSTGLLFTGYGDDPSMRLWTAAGVDLGIPPNDPIPGAGVDAIVRVSTGEVGILGGNAPNFGTTGVGIFNADGTVRAQGAAQGSPSSFAGNGIARDANGYFYGHKSGNGGTRPARIYRYDVDGNATSWNVETGSREAMRSCGVNAAGTVAYFGAFDSSTEFGSQPRKVYAWDIDTNADLGLFATAPTGYYLGDNSNRILVLSNGDVLIAWNLITPTGSPGNILIEHYDSGGSLLYSYDLAAASTGGDGLTGGGITPGLTDDHFWAGVYDSDLTTTSTTRIVKVEVGTGAILANWVPDDGAFEFDGPFCAVEIAAPEPAPDPDPVPATTPLAPLTPCRPDTQVTGGGKGASGCNAGGRGFVLEAVADYGDVPDHADPDDGEDLANKERDGLEAWIELWHTDWPSGDVTTYRRAFVELADVPAYEGGRKVAGLLSLGQAENALWNESGGPEKAGLEIELADARDRLILGLTATQSLSGDPVVVKLASDARRAAEGSARVVYRGIVTKAENAAGRIGKLSCGDALFAEFDRLWPPAFGDLGLAAPTMPGDIKDRAIPSLFGQRTDEGATDPITGHPKSKGVFPAIFVDWFDLGPIEGVHDDEHPDHVWAFFAWGLGEWYRITGFYGSNLGHGTEGETPDRERFDLDTRGDVLHPDHFWPFDATVAITANVEIVGRIVRFTNPDTGTAYDIFGFFARGPVVSDHLHNVVNIAGNGIGRCDGNGLPVMHGGRVQQYWLENDALGQWTSGALADATTYPQWPDGTAKVRSSSFRARQDYYDSLIGGPLLVSWYAHRRQSLNDVVRDMNRSTDGPIGKNGHGQIVAFDLDPSVDASAWPRIDHDAEVYGDPTISQEVGLENVVIGSCDEDADKDVFRVGPIRIRSEEGYARYKQRERETNPPINTVFGNEENLLRGLLAIRLRRLEFGQTLIELTGPIRWANLDVGAGVLLNTEDGPSEDDAGYVNRPCIILRRSIDLRALTVTLTLWDVGNLIVMGHEVDALDRLFLLSDDADECAVLTDDEDVAALIV